MTERYRHKARGTTYRVLFEAAKASSVVAVLDDITMVVYQGEADGPVWVRPAMEFFDGRFERLPPLEKRPHGVSHEMMDAAIAAMNFHGFDFRAPWECTLDDRELEEFTGLQSAVAPALTLSRPNGETP